MFALLACLIGGGLGLIAGFLGIPAFLLVVLQGMYVMPGLLPSHWAAPRAHSHPRTRDGRPIRIMPANSTTTMLGITTLQMGVFGGIVVGLGVAALHNKFYKIELPQVLAFFGGTRFVPIVSSIVYL